MIRKAPECPVRDLLDSKAKASKRRRSARLSGWSRLQFIGLVVVLIVIAWGVWQRSWTADQKAGIARRGPETYLQHCAICHGEKGRGDGKAAGLLFPKPRDFTTGKFRFKSTPDDQLPMQDDLRRIIGGGIQRKAMPAFAEMLSEQQINDLGTFILSLGERAHLSTKQTPIRIPPKPLFTSELVEFGRRVYHHAGCAACHGQSGRGDGPAADTLVDSSGNPIPPADFTTGMFKAGQRAEDFYRAVAIGVPSTPMPSYLTALDQFQIEGVNSSANPMWAVVAYVESISVARPRRGAASGVKIMPIDAPETAMIENPWHVAWKRVPPLVISPRGSDPDDRPGRTINLRLVRAGEQLAFCLEWHDLTFDVTPKSEQGFTDAVAIQFSRALPQPIPEPEPAAAQSPMHIWQWEANRQFNAPTSAVESTLDNHGASQPSSIQNISGTGQWSQGRWRVIMRRSLETSDPAGVGFNGDQNLLLSLTIRDGHDGKEVHSGWHRLIMEP